MSFSLNDVVFLRSFLPSGQSSGPCTVPFTGIMTIVESYLWTDPRRPIPHNTHVEKSRK